MTLPDPALEYQDGCIFCRIVAREADATILYEDETTIAFMDLRQVVEGHCLVIPKRHIRDIFGLDDTIGAEVMSTLRRVCTATKAAFKAEGLSVWQSNDPPWQEVLHLHFHVMPRYWATVCSRYTAVYRDRQAGLSWSARES